MVQLIIIIGSQYKYVGAQVSYPVVAQEGAEVGRLLLVDQLDKAGAVNCVDGREDAAREQTELQKLCYGLILRGFCQIQFNVLSDGCSCQTNNELKY